MSNSNSVVLSFMLCMPVLVLGQQATVPGLPSSTSNAAASVAQEGRIKLDVVVVDRASKPVSDLEANDFAVLDGKTPVKTVSFHAFGGTKAKADPPTEIILLFDYINDDFKNLTAERQEVQGFLKENGGNLAHPVSLFLLRDSGLQALIQGSSDGNALAAQVAKMETLLTSHRSETGANGDIEKFDQSLQAMRNLAAFEAKRPGRKLLLWIGPGWPLLNSPHLQVTNETLKQLFKEIVELSAGLRESRVNVYSIGIGSFSVQNSGIDEPDSNKKPTSGGPATFVEVPDFSNPMDYQAYLKEVKQFQQAKGGNLSVKVLALHNGGRVMGLNNGLKSQIADCLQDASDFYTLSFDPPPAKTANEYHDLKVQIDKPGLTAHTTTGYYGQP